MSFFDIIGMSLSNLFKRFLRTFMTVAGVIIGTCAIIVMVSIGTGLNKSFQDSLENMADLTMINIYGQYNPQNYDNIPITNDTIKFLEGLPNVRSVTPQKSFYDEVYLYTEDQKLIYTGSVIGVNISDMGSFGLNLKEGNFPTKDQLKTHIMVGENSGWDFRTLGSLDDEWVPRWDDEGKPLPAPLDATKLILKLAPKYIPPEKREENGSSGDNGNMQYRGGGGGMAFSPYNDGEEEEPDENLLEFLDNQELVEEYQKPLNISGTIAHDERYWELTGGILMDISLLDELLKSAHTLNEVEGKYEPIKFENMSLRANSMDDVEGIEKLLKEANFNYWSFNENRVQMQQQTMIIQIVLGGLAAISLFVAAIGIFNTMVMAITERTKEIGVMKVLGCSLGDIRAMFLVESGAIGLLGGLAGVVISFLLSYILNTIAGTILQEYLAGMGAGGGSKISIIEPELIIFALIFSVVIGLISGFLPANRATKISALEAINN